MTFSVRSSLLAASLVALAGACGCARSVAFTPPDDAMVGKPAPPFVFRGIGRKAFSSENFDGRTLALIFIRAGQPDLQLLLKEVEKMFREPAFAGVQFIVIAPEEDPLTVPFWTGLHNSLPAALDYTGVAARYGARSLPMIVIRDHKGIVRLRLDGYVGEDLLPRLETTRRILREAVQERSRPAGSAG